MGVIEMTRVSYFFVAMAVVFGCVSVVMYFVLDIRRCWRIVRGTSSVTVQEKVSVINQRTEKLALDKTEKLFSFDETELSETITLVQDIVMTDAKGGGFELSEQ